MTVLIADAFTDGLGSFASTLLGRHADASRPSMMSSSWVSHGC